MIDYMNDKNLPKSTIPRAEVKAYQVPGEPIGNLKLMNIKASEETITTGGKPANPASPGGSKSAANKNRIPALLKLNRNLDQPSD